MEHPSTACKRQKHQLCRLQSCPCKCHAPAGIEPGQPPEQFTDDDYNDELARRLCAAYISTQAGIGMDYALKNYVKRDEPTGTFWLSVAKHVREGMHRRMAQLEQQTAPPASSKPN